MDFVATKHERRILAYLDQHGPTHRTKIVVDLASAASKIGRGIENGSNSAMPLIMGKWSSRLRKAGLIRHAVTRDGFYSHHEITASGRQVLRSSP